MLVTGDWGVVMENLSGLAWVLAFFGGKMVRSSLFLDVVFLRLALIVSFMTAVTLGSL